MKKIISALILTALLLSSILAIIPVAAAEGDTTEKRENMAAGTPADQNAGIAPAFYYDYRLYKANVNVFPVAGAHAKKPYVLSSVNAASGSSTITDGTLESYAGTYKGFWESDNNRVVDDQGVEYVFDAWVGICLKETTTIDAFSYYTLAEKTKGNKLLIEELTIFGAKENPETHTYDPGSWFKMADTFKNVQGTLSEDQRFAVVTSGLYMPFDVDYVFLGFMMEGESGGEYINVELELYEYVGGADENIDFTALNDVIAIAETELAKENTYTTNSFNILSRAYDDAKKALSAKNQMAVDYAASTLNSAILALTPLADTSALEAELAKNASLEEKTYTTSSWAAFVTARDAATTLMETGNASEAGIAEKLAALTAAVSALAPRATATDLALLRAKFAEATALESDDYTSQSFSALKLAIRNTSQLTKEDNKDDVSDAQCEAAMKELVDAIAGLKEKADISALQAIVDSVLSINGKLYTEESYSALASAINDAQQFLSGSASNASAEEADALGAAITAAKDALVPLADYAALNAKIAELEALASADYTAETWKALQDAITAAKTLIDNKATQAEADEALATLEAAAKALATVTGDSTTDNSEKSGCGSVIGATAVVITALLGLGAVALRRKDN